jgi:hypothetical protein
MMVISWRMYIGLSPAAAGGSMIEKRDYCT